MPDFNGGVKGALQLLQGLDGNSQKRIIEDIAKKDPKMAEVLRQNLVQFEDLIYLNAQRIQEVVGEVGLMTLGVALRLSSEELREHFLNNLSKNNRNDLTDIFNGAKRTLKDVKEAQDKIIDHFRPKLESGEIILRKDSEEMV